MQVTKVMPSDHETVPDKRQYTQEQLQIEFNYLQAERITVHDEHFTVEFKSGIEIDVN